MPFGEEQPAVEGAPRVSGVSFGPSSKGFHYRRRVKVAAAMHALESDGWNSCATAGAIDSTSTRRSPGS
jgi:hypothetical protein